MSRQGHVHRLAWPCRVREPVGEACAHCVRLTSQTSVAVWNHHRTRAIRPIPCVQLPDSPQSNAGRGGFESPADGPMVIRLGQISSLRQA
jgi:hypothetical protein